MKDKMTANFTKIHGNYLIRFIIRLYDGGQAAESGRRKGISL